MDIEKQVARLTALEEIRTNIAIYARAGDNKNDPTVMGPLMTEDAVWEAKGFGRHEGRDVIAHELSKIAQERIVWSLHFPVAPIIELNDAVDKAHGFWWLWELLTMRNDEGVEEQNWIGANYECDFVKKPDGWKIQHLILEIKIMVPFTGQVPLP